MDDAPTVGTTARAARRARARNRAAGVRVPEEPPVLAPPVELADGPLGVAQAADREIARLTAVRARALAEFAASRPASADRQPGEPGAMSAPRRAARPQVLQAVSEWAAPELVVALSRSRTDVERLLERSMTLVQRLPRVVDALETGALTDAHLWPVLDLLAPVESDEVRAAVEAEVLRWLAARSAARRITTPPQLREKLRREVLRRGAREAAQAALKAVRERGVHRQAERGEGMAGVAAVLTEPEAQALVLALEAYADAIDDEPGAPPRPRSQKMADVLLDLVLRPGESGHPPVQVALTLVAAVPTLLGGDTPAELGGRVVPAEVARQLLRALTGAGPRLPAPAPSGPSGPSGESWTDVELLQREVADWWADVERRVLAGELEPGPQPLPDDLLAAWGEDLLDPLFDDPPVEDDLADLEALLRPGELLDEADAGAGDPGGSPPAGTGWWASADRAVDDAAAALHDAQLALGRAGRMVRTAQRADLEDERAWRESPAGRVDAADGVVEALRAAADADRELLAELLEQTAGGGLADRPRIALADELSGALVALTDLPALRRAARCDRPRCRRRPGTCEHDLGGRPGLGAPGPTAGYRPGAELDRFLRARDRRCRFPGCRRPVAKGELDHRVRYPDGPTDVANLAGVCTGDHRGKHQAPGWSYEVAADGSLVVTTPSGLVAETSPPPY